MENVRIIKDHQTHLGRYRARKGYNLHITVAEIERLTGIKVPVTVFSKTENAKIWPRAENLYAIVKWTRNGVTADDILNDWVEANGVPVKLEGDE